MNLKSMRKIDNRSAKHENWAKRHKFSIIMAIELVIFVILAVKIR